MLIVCPNCAKSYQVDAPSIGARGRSVRCARCRSIWFAAPPAAASDEDEAAFGAELGSKAAAHELNQRPIAETPATAAGPGAAEPEEVPLNAPEPASLDDLMASTSTEAATGAPAPSDTEAPASAPAETPAIALADIPIPVEGASPAESQVDLGDGRYAEGAATENNREDIESSAIRRRAAVEARRRAGARKSKLPVVIAALAVVCAALLAWRKDAVRHMPQLASFYATIGLPVNLRGLTFTDMKVGRETHDGVPVLVVEGTIVSGVPVPVDVPRLRFALRNSAGAEIYAWTAIPTQSVLEPGAKLSFRSRLASPPDNGHNVEVRFFTRRDTVAGLH